MSRFRLHETTIPGLTLVERTAISDNRGFFERVFCASDLAPAGWHGPIAQINRTFTKDRGTVRGLHFQRAPHAEMKLVSCFRGAIWDVVVDLRSDSATYLSWHAEELSDVNRRALLIPEGCAHGFQSLTDECELLYLHSAPYVPEAEGGLNPRDPRLAIAWPEAITQMSDRDAGHPHVDA